MKHALLFTILIFAINFTSPALAQGNCSPNVTAALASLDAAQSAIGSGDTQAALSAIVEANTALELQIALCRDYAPESVGDSRTNPVPFGQSQYAEISDEFSGSIQIIEYLDDGEAYVLEANDRNDPTPSGARYVVFRLRYACEKPASESCEFSRVYFSIVGDKGVSYRYNSANDYDVSIRDIGEDKEVFGGSEIEVDLAFLVEEDDSNFILFTEYGTPRVFFATPPVLTKD